MKSNQISSMFISLTETEEENLCGGKSVTVSKGLYEGAKVYKASPGKKGSKKQTVKSTTSVVTTKTTKEVKVPELGGLLDDLFAIDLSSLLDW